MKKLSLSLVALLVLLISLPAFAAPVRVFVADMNAIGVQNKDDMKVMLQALLSSRLSSDKVVAVGSAAEADVAITGTYIVIGKIFSVDALAKTVSGKTLTRAFIQGESQDELIPAVGKLAEKLSVELQRLYSGNQVTVEHSSALVSADTGIIKNTQQVRQAPASEFIKPKEYERNNSSGWLSQRLKGASNLMAIGKTLPNGEREIFLAEDRRISYYRQGNEMRLVDEAELGTTQKIISLDTIDDGAGNQDIYVTIIRSDELASQVWQVKDNKLARVAEGLPYYFRSIALGGGTKKIYAQAMGREDDFYGDVSEVGRNGSKISLKNPIKMPRYGNIYSFNQFTGNDNKTYTVVINPDNYLVVYDPGLHELWRSNDRFGGSELYFQKEDLVNVRTTGDKNRWIFMDQRIQVTTKGELLVGKNDGFWVLGNARSYKKGAVYCLAWNGSSLEEKWRTRDTQNYMPDYFYDESKNELLILQTVQRTGISERGASALAIKKVE